MLHIVVETSDGTTQLDHGAGPFEFGRGAARDTPRCVIADPHVSRNHLRVEELTPGRVQLENLSQTAEVVVHGGPTLAPGARDEVALPVHLAIGTSAIRIGTDGPPAIEGLETITRPARLEPATAVRLSELGAAPDLATLLHWFETLVHVEQAAATSQEFFGATARAVVDLVGLDRGLVLLADPRGWQVAASHARVIEHGPPSFSRSIVDRVFRERRTFFRNIGPEDLSRSLLHVESVVAAPVLDATGTVVGVVYGSRDVRPTVRPPDVTPLEARVVQVLAAAVGAGLARERSHEEATRLQLQFEQFFSADLARELTRDPSLLDGREREVTILFSDVRAFSRLSERLGPERTFRLMQEVMELQSTHVRNHDGVVVDYVGDGMLAMWNAPTDQPDHAEQAARAALAILAELPTLAARWQDTLGEPLRLGIGINTGTALVGNTGSRLKFKYGPMGPTVNIASRTEDATKSLGVPLAITGSTAARLSASFARRRLCRARLAGIGSPIDLHELRGVDVPPDALQLERRYETALTDFETGRWVEACHGLAPLIVAGEDRYDVPSVQLMSRAVDCLRTRPDPFDPTFDIA